MADRSQLVMPKLGLTMTEGRIATWVVRPGARFATGDVVVIIETDKIANEVEAPAAGEMLDLLVSEGTTHSVGTPIARWALDAAAADVPLPCAAADARPPVAVPKGGAVRGAPHPSGGRLIATPYARRLAAEGGLSLATIAGSGPRGRIKGADVLIARDQRSDRRDGGAVVTAGTRPTMVERPQMSVATIEVDVSAVTAMADRLARSQSSALALSDFLVLACVRVLTQDGTGSARIGFALRGEALRRVTATARETLTSLAAKLAAAHDEANRGTDAGDIAVRVAGGRIGLFAPTAPDGWPMALSAGGIRPLRGNDGAPAQSVTLVLTYDAGAVPHDTALERLETVAALLEEPLHLLAT